MKSIPSIQYSLIFLIQLLSPSLAVSAQIDGSENVALNSTETYSYDDGNNHFGAIWEVTGGSAQDLLAPSPQLKADITWTSTGTHTITLKSGRTVLASLVVEVGSLPDQPSAPTVSTNNCGIGTVNMNGTSPSGVTWYWQSSSSGTTTDYGSENTITVNSSGTWFLRGHNEFGWGPASSAANITVNSIPNVPDEPVLSLNLCGERTLTSNNADSDANYYWQTTSQGTSVTNSSTEYVVESSGTYYLRARSNLGGCWSDAVGIQVEITDYPEVPPAPTLIQNCGSTTLTRSNPENGVTYYWQNTADGTSTSNYSAQLTFTNGAKHYLRAKTNNAGCWSAAREINYTVMEIPTTPTLPTITNNCGSTILTRQTPPEGTTYYWQSDIDGIDTSNANKTITRTSGIQYFIRARNENTECWGPSRAINYNINENPEPPVNVTVNNECGSTTLLREAPPTGLTYYWQIQPNDTNTSNDNFSTNLTTGTQYFLRARDNSSSCWSSALTINYNVHEIPVLPANVITADDNCGSSTISRETAPEGLRYFWQNTADETEQSNDLLSFEVDNQVTYYLRAVNINTMCWSSAVSISANPLNVPPTPGGFLSSNLCGPKSITLPSNPSNTTWYWQSSLSGEDESIADNTFDVQSTGSYFVRGLDSNTDCWGNAAQFDITINDIPRIPSQSDLEFQCESTIISIGSPPDGDQWFWQSNESGKNTHDSENHKIATEENQTFFIRAKASDSNCWSETRVISTPVITKPNKPSSPIVSTNDCGSKTISFDGYEPDAVDWYWQMEADGKSIDFGSDEEIMVDNENTTVVYLRARNSECWSDELSNSGLFAVVPYPVVEAGSNFTVFASGQVHSLDATPTGGSWWHNDTLIPESNTAIEALGLGTHLVSYSYETPGEVRCQSSDLAQITVVDNPSLTNLSGSNTIVPLSEEGIILESEAGHINYQWYRNGEAINEVSHRLTTLVPGEYQVEVTNSSGHIGISESLTLVLALESNGQNAVVITDYRSPLQSVEQESSIKDLTIGSSFYDGLGRIIQKVDFMNSYEENDVILPHMYDSLGRSSIAYLPYTDNGFLGWYRPNACGSTHTESDQYHFYQTAAQVAHDVHPYAIKVFEPSPLNRILKQGAPGTTWQPKTDDPENEHVIHYEYGLNGYEEVNFWQIDESSDLPEVDGFYGISQLSTVTTTDENGNQTIVYTNKLGQTVLKKVQAGNGVWAKTAYLYDDFGNLRYVLSPLLLANNTLDAGELDELTFQYKYDHRQRMIEKKVPGAGWVYMVYDDRDRLVLTQDGNQRSTVDGGTGREWTFTKYDAFNRPTATGLYEHLSSLDQAQMQAFVNGKIGTNTTWYDSYIGGASNHGYDHSSFPTSNIAEVHTITYYDHYGFLGDGHWDLIASCPETLPNAEPLCTPGGQITGSKIRQLGGEMLESVTFYDDRYRVVQIVSENQMDGTDIVDTEYFNEVLPLVKKTTRTHTTSVGTHVIAEEFTYDHGDRLLSKITTIDGKSSTTHYEYNELGELIEKDLRNHSGGLVQSIDYKYNIRGWLRRINNGTNFDDATDKFGMLLQYDNSPTGFEQYNGNIGKITWKSKGGKYSGWQHYKFRYDPMNRLKRAAYGAKDRWGYYAVYGNSDGGIRYDLNGNIRMMMRKQGFDSLASLVDRLWYGYDNGGRSNRLIKVNDSGNTGTFTENGQTYTYKDFGFKDGVHQNIEYFYDANGNMTRDLNKGISDITYNHLNLPVRVVKDDGSYVLYAYDAAGTKLSKEFVQPGISSLTTVYVGGIQYTRFQSLEDGAEPANFRLDFIMHEDGRALADHDETSGDYLGVDYQYNLTDHLGNVRVTVDEGGNTVQVDDYYPFGLTFNSYKAGTENNYLYNQGTSGKTHQGKEGKSFKTERQPELGWDMTKFRMYDYALGRFINVDPLADAAAQESLSPYHYVRNNPINYNDPYGDCDWCLDALQTGLDVAGMVPAVGNIADLANAGISAARGDYVGMTLSLAAAVPLAGLAAGGTKLVRNGMKVADKVNDTRKATLKANKIAGAKGEKIVTEKLQKEFKNDEVLEQVTGKFSDGTKTRFDNVVVDGKTGKVKVANETKTGNAQLSKQQKRVHEGGESVTLTGKNAGDAAGQNVNSSQTRTTRVKKEELE